MHRKRKETEGLLRYGHKIKKYNAFFRITYFHIQIYRSLRANQYQDSSRDDTRNDVFDHLRL